MQYGDEMRELSPNGLYSTLSGINNLVSCKTISVNRTCEQGYTLIENRCYKIHTQTRLLWEDARLDCESNRGSLAIIDTTEKLHQLASLLQSQTSKSVFNIGLARDMSSWSWLDGTTVNASLFSVGYPEFWGTDETCLVMFNSAIYNLRCDVNCGYACQSSEGKTTR